MVDPKRMIRTYVDLFAGCGGLSLGLQASGFTNLFAVEAHTDAFETYKQNLLVGSKRSQWPLWLERRPWRAEELLAIHEARIRELRGSLDLIAGGPPCQGFSFNGLRRPDDPRSQLVDVYLKFVEIARPRLVLLENVVGFKSMKHRCGDAYSSYVAETLEGMGYDTWTATVRAAEWGVPQLRPRFILIAAIKGSLPGIDPMQRLRVSRRKFLDARNLGHLPISAEQAISDLEEDASELELDVEWGHLGFKALKRADAARSSYQKLMRANTHGQPTDMRLARHNQEAVKRMREILQRCERGVSLRPKDRESLGIRKRSTTPLDRHAPSPTITTLPDDLIHYSQPRSMTVREHARLQSFPDWFLFTGPYTTGGVRRREACPRYTQVGNAVPPLLAEAIGETLLGLLLQSGRKQDAHFPESVQMCSESSADIRKVIDSDLVGAY